MTGRIEIYADAGLGLMGCHYRSDFERVRSCGVQVVDEDVEVEHFVLLSWLLWPDGRAVPGLALEG